MIFFLFLKSAPFFLKFPPKSQNWFSLTATLLISKYNKKREGWQHFSISSKTTQGTSLIVYLLEAQHLLNFTSQLLHSNLYTNTQDVYLKTVFLFICFIAHEALLIASCCRTFDEKLYTWNIFGTHAQREYSFLQKKNGTHFRYHCYHNRIWSSREKKRGAATDYSFTKKMVQIYGKKTGFSIQTKHIVHILSTK